MDSRPTQFEGFKAVVLGLILICVFYATYVLHNIRALIQGSPLFN